MHPLFSPIHAIPHVQSHWAEKLWDIVDFLGFLFFIRL